jgi:hypothetical protein
MSNWEERLRAIAEGTAWDLPKTDQVKSSLQQLQSILKNVSEDTGLTGSTGVEASATLADAKKATQELVDYLNDLPAAIEAANDARAAAQKALSELGSGSLTPDQTALIRGAEIGATVVVGPIAIVAGEGAIAAANAFFGNKREDEAKAAVEAVTTKLDEARGKLQDPPEFVFEAGDTTPSGPAPTSPPIGGDGGPSGPSFEEYPDYDFTISPGCEGFALIDEEGWVIDNGKPTDIQIDRDPGTPIVIPTPDGPITGGVTFPGGGGGSGTGLLGGGSGGLGSGLMAGAGGAAALGGLSRLSGAGAATLARLAGLRGGPLSGAGGLGGGGSVRGTSGGLTANAGGGKAGSGGLLGARGGAGASSVAAEGAAGRGGMGMAGGAGGAGGAGAGKGSGKQRGRGLGGPIAPRLEDDEEFGPLSENAGAGGRE